MFTRLLLFVTITAVALANPTRRSLPSGNVECGSNTYTVSEVSAAVSAGFAHVDDPLGSDSYPHAYYDEASEDIKLYCSGSSWLEYPIMAGGKAYTGGDPETDRVVFNTGGTYCAVVTHTGAASYDGFVSCKGD
ncbi:guanyl-specific ribonuclease C2 [Roridomyces roridus]|uniref:Guanyl-specific ribonuclease C2 n=1 Tax=Roridomyces roridus TaxID=1738132 RepID=A0AAD7FCJ0_9AGAR|nr:guanyl-specific ribonuclease C2 [Roridomyces roridus]